MESAGGVARLRKSCPLQTRRTTLQVRHLGMTAISWQHKQVLACFVLNTEPSLQLEARSPGGGKTDLAVVWCVALGCVLYRLSWVPRLLTNMVCTW